MMKRNPYKLINGKAAACCISVNRWLISRVKNICSTCGIQFKIDDSSVDYSNDCVDAVFAADDQEAYIDAACMLHNELGIDLA